MATNGQRSGRFRVLGIDVDRLDQQGAARCVAALIDAHAPAQIVTVNPEFVMLARHDSAFRRVLQAAALATADGMGIVWAARLLGDRLPERVGGVELLEHLAAQAAALGHTIFLLGAGEGVAEAAALRLRERYAGLRVVGCHAGSPAWEDEASIQAMIRAAHPQLLFVAFGAPAQELWIHRNLPQLGSVVAMGVGGAFDYISGRVPRAPRTLQRLGLEWLYRLARQPWRWRRMLALPRFGLLILLERRRGPGRRPR